MADDGWVDVPAHGRKSKKRQHSDDCDNGDEAGDSVVYQSPRRGGEDATAFRPFVLLLVGIPGSGKSHFSSKLEDAMPDKFVRVNQDKLKTRQKCEKLARKTLAEGKVAVIDRCNFNDDQRKTWIDMAREANVDCECIVFEYDRDTCIARCQKRLRHETMHPSKAAGVVSFMAGRFRPPLARGEFRRVHRVSSFDQANAVAESYLRGQG
ncbi:hypothetical protein ACHAXT_006859 [Thalassiosira profunda]